MVEVKIGNKGMTAEVKVTPEQGEVIDEKYVKQMLQLEGVQAGIQSSVLKYIVDNKVYGKFVPVAAGKEAVDGVDGYYDFHFVTTNNNKAPRIKEDGSVDYTMAITNVNKDDLVAEYHPRTTGTYGYNVFATVLPPKMGKDKVALRYNGVRQEENKYYADKSGLITMKDNTLLILDVLEIKGDVDQTVGDLEFNGDIQIHGSILTNMTVKAHGSIMVDGVVESAFVKAEKDIFVAKGIHGKGKGRVEAAGNVCATFISHSFVYAGGDVRIDYSVGSEIEADGKVLAEGDHGLIAGGTVSAVKGVEAISLGNNAELDTAIYAGALPKMKKEVDDLKLQIQKLKLESEKTKQDSDFENIMNEIDGLRDRILVIEDMQRDFRTSPIIVHKYIYPGAKCFLSGLAAPDYVYPEYKNSSKGSNKFGLMEVDDIEIRLTRAGVVCKRIGEFTKEEIDCFKSKEKAKVKLRILAIDDDPKILHMVNEMLRENYQISVARGGESARKFLTKKSVDLILLDYMMPKENGAEVLKSFRKEEKTKNIPVVFLTALEDRKKIMECLSLRPAGYVAKPVDSKTLNDKIRAVLSTD